MILGKKVVSDLCPVLEASYDVRQSLDVAILSSWDAGRTHPCNGFIVN